LAFSSNCVKASCLSRFTFLPPLFRAVFVRVVIHPPFPEHSAPSVRRAETKRVTPIGNHPLRVHQIVPNLRKWPDYRGIRVEIPRKHACQAAFSPGKGHVQDTRKGHDNSDPALKSGALLHHLSSDFAFVVLSLSDWHLIVRKPSDAYFLHYFQSFIAVRPNPFS
jgi:hypothetical protein